MKLVRNSGTTASQAKRGKSVNDSIAELGGRKSYGSLGLVCLPFRSTHELLDAAQFYGGDGKRPGATIITKLSISPVRKPEIQFSVPITDPINRNLSLQLGGIVAQGTHR